MKSIERDLELAKTMNCFAGSVKKNSEVNSALFRSILDALTSQERRIEELEKIVRSGKLTKEIYG